MIELQADVKKMQVNMMYGLTCLFGLKRTQNAFWKEMFECKPNCVFTVETP